MAFEEGGSAGPEFVGGKGKVHIPQFPKFPRKISRILAIFVILLVVMLAVFTMCVTYIHPYEYGIKEVKIGVTRGILQKQYEPGWAFIKPFGLERMHLIPRHVLALELSAFESQEKNRPGASRYTDKVAKIQTSDGFYVDVDATILYRITDPYKLITTIGPGELYLFNGILPKAEPILKQAFGELTTEDFYNNEKRIEKGVLARELLNKELESKGMTVEHVLVRYFKYSEEIQKNIEAKKLQDQLVFKNQAAAKAAAEEAELKRVTQEGEMKVKVTIQGGDAYKQQKGAERDLYTRSKTAEADLLVQLAEAKRTELRNQSMQVVGSDLMVAQKMSEVLSGMDTIVVPCGGSDGFNPLDLTQVLKLFGVSGQPVPLKPPTPGETPPVTPVAPTPQGGPIQ